MKEEGGGRVEALEKFAGRIAGKSSVTSTSVSVAARPEPNPLFTTLAVSCQGLIFKAAAAPAACDRIIDCPRSEGTSNFQLTILVLNEGLNINGAVCLTRKKAFKNEFWSLRQQPVIDPFLSLKN